MASAADGHAQGWRVWVILTRDTSDRPSGAGRRLRSDPEPASTVAESDFISGYARAVCDALQGCCAAVAAPLGRDACITTMSRKAESGVRIRSSSSVYDGKRAFDCIEKARLILVQRVWNRHRPKTRLRWSAARAVGTLPIGADCETEYDCAPSNQGRVLCLKPLGSSTGQYGILRPAAAGEMCFSVCEEDLYCGLDQRRVPRLPDGAVCQATPNCARLLSVSPSEPGRSSNRSCRSVKRKRSLAALASFTINAQAVAATKASARRASPSHLDTAFNRPPDSRSCWRN